MADQEDPRKLSDALEREADQLERHSRELESKLEETRQDWERKRADEGVPGAPPPEGRDESADQRAPEDPDGSSEAPASG
jgi:hypothetical protein